MMLVIIIFSAVPVVLCLVFMRMLHKADRKFEALIKQKEEGLRQAKNLRIFFLISLASILNAQPSTLKAQSVSSNALSLTWIGYIDAAYHLSITNKQTCSATVEIRYNCNDTFLIVPASATSDIHLPCSFTTGSEIRIRTQTICNTFANAGWLKFTVPVTLPIRIEKFKAHQKFNSILVSLRVHATENEIVKMEKSPDGRVWHTAVVYACFDKLSMTIDTTWTDHQPTTYNFYRIGSEIIFTHYIPTLQKYWVYTPAGQFVKEFNAANRSQLINALSPGQWLIKSSLSNFQIFKLSN